MKVKYLLTALALPAMFAACSQDDIVTDVQNQPAELLGEVAGDVDFSIAPMSRLAWGTSGDATWEAEDGFSLFWVGDNPSADAALTGKVNALYKKASGEDKFTSQNIVYVGKHLIVYPADYAHMSEKAIEVSVGANQDGSVALGKRSVWTTDSLLTIAKPVAEKDEVPGTIYAGGYGEPVPASLEALSSNLVLNLGFKMGNATNINVKKVVLRADDGLATPTPVDVFATGGILKAQALNGTYNRNVVFESPADSIHSEVALTVNETVSTSDTTCTVQFALLPNTTATIPTANYYIDVYTNYGVVTISKAKYVTAKGGKIYCDNVAAGTEVGKEAADYDEDLDLTEEIKLMAEEYDEEYLYRTSDATKKSKVTAYGKRITLNVTVDMADADINNMEVATTADLIAAYETYDLLEKNKEEDFVTFKLNSKTPFELTPAAVTAILGNTAVTLDNIGNDTIKLTGAHTSIPALQYVNEDEDIVKLFTQMGSTPLLLGAEGTWAIDVDNAPTANAWGKIINGGTLTISESNTKDKAAVALGKGCSVTIENQDSVVISGNVVIPVAYVQKAGATSIPADAYLDAKNAVTFNAGKVYVDGYLAVTTGGNVYNKGNVIVNGIVNTTTGSFTNVGTIKLAKEDAYVIISANAEGVTNGSIESYARNSSATVSGDALVQGYIKWNCDVTEFTGADDDTFNYAILNGNLNVKEQGTLKHIEIAEGKKVSLKETIEVPESRSAADGKLDLGLVKVNKNATLIVPTGSQITYKSFDNGGHEALISGTFVDVMAQANASTIAEAISYGRSVTLTGDITETLTIPAGYNGTINLNSYTVGKIINNGQLIVKNGNINNVDSEGGSLTLKDVVVEAANMAGTDYYAINVVKSALTLENVTLSATSKGGVSICETTATLKNTNLSASDGTSLYDMHVVGSNVSYDDEVAFDTSYIQTKASSSDAKYTSIVNKGVFKHDNVAPNAPNNATGYIFNTKAELEAMITSLTPAAE